MANERQDLEFPIGFSLASYGYQISVSCNMDLCWIQTYQTGPPMGLFQHVAISAVLLCMPKFKLSGTS
ncbi:hypothetical protein SODALDRAFT_357478 [Sodiomyces alkalinus F11]|uniref:Uncharacterized protein n=1 Tax=Sodiomyces alkalinus (strain CBS 110278 / VKM F-3762 / F11) TaxID=1314773 RepID=A0A3N2Q486_SODAK|nr:hypothetical protein SODALDRAFT_357478 [Sodiomyces alkalinus F11]ROT41435.1 hypothetical protein SODALDRAFT_357478 [Sodiomyces alkalinus F11]